MNKISIQNLSLEYSDGTLPLMDVSINIPTNQISVLFGPAGGGKSSLLRTINRLNDLADVKKINGQVKIVLMDGNEIDVMHPKTDVISLRRQVGMVFARPIVLPLTIRQNLTYSLELSGQQNKIIFEEIVERSLRQAALWDEVKDRLDERAVNLSGGQQQRLCLARSLMLEPEIILLDEPTSGLDPISTGKVEDSLQELKEKYTILIVPHSVQQAARIADFAGFLLQGKLIETAVGKGLFLSPKVKQTQDYVEGRFG
jgi:phosphate transport system ATP-binding protein